MSEPTDPPVGARLSYREIASRPRPGTLGAIIDAAEKMPRTLPRDPASREALESVGERPRAAWSAYYG
jgi:hypothetical protein